MTDEYSPDESPENEAFEQEDEALDERSRLNPDFDEEVELDPSLNPDFQGDERELEELGADLDDPEKMAVLEGGIDDPDGVGEVSARLKKEDDDGWDLDAPETKDIDLDEDDLT
ncbi:MAG: hypothetical protein WAM97_14655 [Acidimicrobiales bacterium]|jgi:hypothetical protein